MTAVMIALLQQMQQARTDPGISLSPKAADLLEWGQVTEQIARFCLNERAARQIRLRQPFCRLTSIDLVRSIVDELRPALDRQECPPLVQLSEMLAQLEQPPPFHLEGQDLVRVAGAAEALDQLREYFSAGVQETPVWAEAAGQMTVFTSLVGEIRRALAPDGTVHNEASPLLARLRGSIAGQESEIRQQMQRAMSHARSQGWTTGDEVTLRGDRFCLPLRSGDSRKVEGIIHDRSVSGATLFIEPAGVVRLANDLVETRLAMAQEEARILGELNKAVELAKSPLQEGSEVLLLADETQAHLRWSRRVGGRRPNLADHNSLRIVQGRHPLLMEVLGEGDPVAGRDKVVPLDLELDQQARVVVISGPNAGGKSVALKTVGVFCLLAQCGWDVPAREDTTLPLMERLLVDLGDDQSITESLSSFSAHLAHLGSFLREADGRSLVLCDEIGSGTDPQEGCALAFAVLEELAGRGALVLASTHFGLLKAAVHDHPRMLNAAMGFDEINLRPLFTIHLGDPGTSQAFAIARRLGLADELLDRAQSLVGQERVQVEQLLQDLNSRSRELAASTEEVRRLEEELRTRSQELTDRLSGLDKERKQLLARVRQEGEAWLRQGRQEVERTVKEIRSRGADRTVVKQAQDHLARLADNLPETDIPTRSDVELAPGMRVRIPHLGLIGTIVEVRGDKIVAMAQELRLTLSRDVVEPLDDGDDGPVESSAPGTRAAGHWSWQTDAPAISPEIDLRGQTGEEAWLLLDRLIDRAIPVGLNLIRVIHGMGTGRLREHLQDRLKADPRVVSYQEAIPSAGGSGVTEVRLGGD